MYISRKTVVDAALKALSEGRLQFQKPDLQGSGCSYTGPCAIGVALTPEQAQFLDLAIPDPTISHLIRADLVDTDDEKALVRIQEMHDDFVHLRANGEDLDALEDRMRSLLESL